MNDNAISAKWFISLSFERERNFNSTVDCYEELAKKTTYVSSALVRLTFFHFMKFNSPLTYSEHALCVRK